MIKFVLLIALVSSFTSANPTYDKEWESYKLKYGKNYESIDEEAERRLTFINNLKTINAHNEKADRGLYTYRMGINPFTSWTPDEFKSSKFGLKLSTDDQRKTGLIHRVNPRKAIPDSVDWRSKFVTRIKDQDGCNACYAFAAISALESASAQATGQLVEFSEQNLLDCSWHYNNRGCCVGSMTNSFKYVKDNKGIATETSYPFTSERRNDTLTCGFKGPFTGAISNYVEIAKSDENALLSAVAQQVVTVAINGTGLSHYESGIFQPTECDLAEMKDFNHGVAVVGYGTENGTDYWIIKNSWGSDWGESGYLRMVRGKNMCGIAEYASYPII